MALIADLKKIKKGETVFCEGDEAKALFILADGSIDLIKFSAGGKEQFVRRVKKGEMFAEAAVFSGDVYPATAIAAINSLVLAIGKMRFLSFIGNHPEVSLNIMGTMAKLLRHLNKLVADLSLGSVETRLAAYLVNGAKEAGKNVFTLEIQKRELAFRLGMVSETLSRSLGKLKKRNIIDIEGKKIIIKDMDKLEDLAD